MSDFIDFVIAAILLYLVLRVLKFSFDGGPVQITCVAFCRISLAYGIPFFGMPAARAVRLAPHNSGGQKALLANPPGVK
jgi:hypothetical protein